MYSRLYSALDSTAINLFNTYRRRTFTTNMPHTVFPDNTGIFKHGSFTVQPIPILEDNYAFLLTDTHSSKAALVDPADANTIMSALNQIASSVSLTHILTTHKHWDHAGGNIELKQHLPDIIVVGGAPDDVAGCTLAVNDGDIISIGTNIQVKVLYTPCHTRGHVLYYVSDGSDPQQPSILFTGDTLLIAGCGKFLEGTAAQMHKILNTVVASLPASTYLYVGHECTVSNLQFAQWVEPHNTDIAQHLSEAQKKRSSYLTTLPSTIDTEKTINPFMRVNVPAVRDRIRQWLNAADVEDDVSVLAALKEAENQNAHKQSAG